MHDDELARDLIKQLGKDSVVRVLRVQEIPARPSGKRVLIANEVKPKMLRLADRRSTNGRII